MSDTKTDETKGNTADEWQGNQPDPARPAVVEYEPGPGEPDPPPAAQGTVADHATGAQGDEQGPYGGGTESPGRTGAGDNPGGNDEGRVTSPRGDAHAGQAQRNQEDVEAQQGR